MRVSHSSAPPPDKMWRSACTLVVAVRHDVLGDPLSLILGEFELEFQRSAAHVDDMAIGRYPMTAAGTRIWSDGEEHGDDGDRRYRRRRPS